IKAVANVADEPAWQRRLYMASAAPRRTTMTAIPYYAWGNREPGPMKVWLPVAPPTPPTGDLERQATVSLSFISDNCQPFGINDGVEPKTSHDHPAALCHWWPHKGRPEWAQYSWSHPVTVDAAKVYWFEDEGTGECRLPESWQVQYLADGI